MHTHTQVDSEQKLQEVDTMEFNSLKANFVEEFFLLDRLVFKHAGMRPMVGQHPITGSIICDMVVKYLDTIKSRYTYICIYIYIYAYANRLYTHTVHTQTNFHTHTHTHLYT